MVSVDFGINASEKKQSMGIEPCDYLRSLIARSVDACYAHHYQKYSDSCRSPEDLGWAEKYVRDEKLYQFSELSLQIDSLFLLVP